MPLGTVYGHRRYLSPVKSFALSLAAVGIAASVALAGSPSRAAVPSCAERFPEATWRTESVGPISIESSALTQALADRFVGEIDLAAGWILDEIGPFEVTVCLVGVESTFDRTRWVSGSQRFHAYMDMDSRLFAVNTDRTGFVGPASAWALAHHALWQHGVEGGNPEPISSVIAHWYRARLLDRLDLYHVDVMVDNFFDTEAVISWTADRQTPTLEWDPETNFTAIGDFIDFAVAQHGTEVLLESDPRRWSDIEAEWRVALRADLTGRTTPTTGWIAGVSIALAIVLVALVAAAAGIYSKRRRRRRPPTGEAIPGFFSE